MIRKIIVLTAIVSSIASSQVARAVLYGVSDGQPGSLYLINEFTGAATLIAPVSPGKVSLTGASFLGGELYATDVFDVGDIMGTIDVSSGAYTPTINQGSINWHGLASDESAGLLYTIDIDAGNTLKSITPGGVVTAIGSGAGIDGRGMAFDGVNDILYATNAGDSGLYRVDTATGSAQLIGGMGINAGLIGLAYDDDSQTLYANEAESRSLYRVDVTTGLATLIGFNLVDEPINGLAWVHVPEPTSFALIAVGALAPACLRRRRCGL